MSDNKVTLDQLDNSAIEAMSSTVGDVSMLNTENKTIVGAISEIVGKKEIANAIGEPLAETDKFTEMSSEINGLLSTFKTNMMNAGVVVESGDKFKALIDKIKGLTEGEGNKGIQFAEGTYTRTEDFLPLTTNVVYNLNFTPTFVLLNIGNMVECCANYNMYNVWISNLNQTVIPSKSGDGYSYKLQLTDITNSSFNITNNSTYGIGYINNIKWYAIGVGEEDTTLRDSLASILGDKGVDVSDEDDMASLIGKVDSIETGVGLDIISATELPTTGRENQICIINSDSINNYLVTSDFTEESPSNRVTIYLGGSTEGGTILPITTNNLTIDYCINKVCYGEKRLSSYYYKNGSWVNLTEAKTIFVQNGVEYNVEIFGGMYTGNSIWKSTNGYLVNSGGSSNAPSTYMTTVNNIDFSQFKSIQITVKLDNPNNYVLGDSGKLFVYQGKKQLNAASSYHIDAANAATNYISGNKLSKTINVGEFTVLTYDISSWTGEHYLGFNWYCDSSSTSGVKLTISEISLL